MSDQIRQLKIAVLKSSLIAQICTAKFVKDFAGKQMIH
jgi:hypothetical protein